MSGEGDDPEACGKQRTRRARQYQRATWQCQTAVRKRETIPLMREEGTTPMDSTLAKFCNSPIRFADNASSEDVIAATKHFGRQAKAALELGSKII